jgi:hypothetical protein
MPLLAMNASRRTHTFTCRDDLWGAFEARARELSCSVDWLLGEAMKRLLHERALQQQAPRALPAPPGSASPSRLPPPPPPPPRKRPTGSFVGPRPEGIALRVGDDRFVVDRDRFVIGRAARDANLVVRDAGVSRQHAILERVEGEGWVVVDMASTNGVVLNGSPVTRARVRPGDVIVIGPAQIRVERA